MAGKRVTMAHIAKEAGVSLGTVDRALNNREGIRDDVKKKILHIAQDLGYKKNALASALSTKNKKKVAVIYPMKPEFFWTKLNMGIRDAEKEFESYGIEFIKYKAEEMWAFSENYILQCLDQVLKEKVDLVAMVAYYSVKVKDKLNDIIKAGIHFVSFNEEYDDVKVLFHVGIDNNKYGRLAAELMGKFLGGHGNILIVNNSTIISSDNHKKRIQEFKNFLKQQFPEVNIVGSFTYDETMNKEYNIDLLKGILGSSALLNGVYDFDGTSLSKVGSAIKELDKGGEFVVVGHEISKEVAELLKENVITGIVSQDPYAQGYELIKNISHFILHGEGQQNTVHNMDLKIILGENSNEQYMID